jgi:hypothetical protein
MALIVGKWKGSGLTCSHIKFKESDHIVLIYHKIKKTT